MVAVAAGGWHTCRVNFLGNLICSGCNDYGQCDVPPDLGPVVAAGWYEVLVLPASWGKDTVSPSLAEPVVQHVDHSGPATLIPADEAAAIVAQEEASFIEHNINSVAWGAPAASQAVCHVAAAL